MNPEGWLLVPFCAGEFTASLFLCVCYAMYTLISGRSEFSCVFCTLLSLSSTRIYPKVQ